MKAGRDMMPAVARPLLERACDLAALTAAAGAAAHGHGSVALVAGEAGIGKSSLVAALRDALPAELRMLAGYCDDLTTPRTLGPIRDLAGSVGPELTAALRTGADRDAVLAALHAELRTPTVLVIEDVHWADDATLDVLRFLIRRVSVLPALLVLTYRDDAVSREHPVQHMLGQAAGAERVHRLALEPLSRTAVHTLSSGSTLDSVRLHEVTAGNPFFVHEVLAHDQGLGVPPTVVDAVLSRVHRLGPAALDALERLAVIPSTVERWLADAVLPDGVPALAAAEEHGLVTVSPAGVAFRHELSRRAIADSLPGTRRVEFNRLVLAALLTRAEPDLSRVMHHAAEGGDLDAIATYGPDAARDAVRAGARREAAAHYRLVLDQRERFAPAERADLLEAYAIECYTIGDAPEAVAAQTEALGLRRELGDRPALGANLRWLSRMQWWRGHRPAAEEAASEAIDTLTGAGDQRLLALAYSNQAQLLMLVDENERCIAYGERAVALARKVGDPGILSHALNNVGSAHWSLGRTDVARAELAESLSVALAAGEVDHACRAYVNTGWRLMEDLELDEAERYIAGAMALAEGAEHVGFLGYGYLGRALIDFHRGAWDDAVYYADVRLDCQLAVTRCWALTVKGRVRVRRGHPGGDELLARAMEIAEEVGELDRVGLIAAGRAEAAWLRGDADGAYRHVRPVYEWATRVGRSARRAELEYWMGRSGHPVQPARPEHPYALQLAGEAGRAAAAWEAYGFPYERATALAETGQQDDLLTALDILDQLDAEPLARIVRARLRDLGAHRIPRGPAATTRQNPAGLTNRQIEVARMVGAGMTNAEIAAHLVVSVRTIDNHVAAVLQKLGATTRREVSARARSLGVELEPAPSMS
jgi:DNA-binding CsgD family transcriptional regulator/tetratricopeptide (TPR) repeat protein